VMARAAVQVAALNVRINAQSLKNKDLARNWSDSVAALESTVENLVEDTMAQVAVRGGF
jgi:formiminotetrahydrofolate cyclodeaminase